MLQKVTYKGDPHQYERKLVKKNYESYCIEEEQREDGLYRCTFHKREANLKEDIDKGIIHRCNFEKVKRNTTILSYYQPKEVQFDEDEITYDDIMTRVAMVVGRRNLSLEAGASKEMHDLIKTAIEFGMQNAKAKAKADDIFKKYTADTVRKYVISTAFQVNKAQFDLFRKLPFVGVSCDEGTTRGVHDLDFVLENPLSGLHPYPCFTSVMNGGKAPDYTEHLARGLDFLRIARIPVGSITVDGNRAQKKALSFEWKDSLRRRYLDHDDFLKHILVNPCLCHKINNAYKASYKTSVDVLIVVDYLRDLCEQCRKHPEDILCVCPKTQLSRWVIDYDLCTFILNHSVMIKKFTDINENELQKFHRVLSILKSLTNIFEDPKTPHFKAFRILENAIGALDAIKDQVCYAEDIAKLLKKYCFESDDAGIWMLSYLLTPEGRADFCMRINKKVFPKKPDYNTLFKVQKKSMKDDIDNVIDLSMENVDIPQKPEDYSNELQSILTPIKDDDTDYTDTGNDDDEDIFEEKDDSFTYEYEEEEEDIIEYELEEEEVGDKVKWVFTKKKINNKNSDDYNYYYSDFEEEEQHEISSLSSNNNNNNDDDDDIDSEVEKARKQRLQQEAEKAQKEKEQQAKQMLKIYPAQKCLDKILTDWGIAEVSRKRTIAAFNSFIKEPDDMFDDQTLENGDYYWEHIRDLGPIWNTLAEIAMRLHCSPCSEASCERTISLQRIVLTARRMSSKKDLLDARLTLLRGLNKED